MIIVQCLCPSQLRKFLDSCGDGLPYTVKSLFDIINKVRTTWVFWEWAIYDNLKESPLANAPRLQFSGRSFLLRRLNSSIMDFI